jgi:hypothetical protein
MATMQHVVNRALKRLGLVPLGKAADFRELTTGNAALNDMLSSWESDFGPAYSHLDRDLSDAFPLDDEHIQGVSALLAERLLDEKGKEISDPIRRDARQGWLTLQSLYVEAPEAEYDRGLTTTPLQANYNNDILGSDAIASLISSDGSSLVGSDGSFLII